MLSTTPLTTTTSGVRVSCSPRSTPVAASITSSGVVPRKAMRKYVAAWSVTSGPGPEGADERAGERDAEQRRHEPDEHGEPEPVDALGERAAPVAGAEVAGDAAGGAVGEEHAQPHDGLEHDGGDAEPGELRRTEVADDRGVGEQEQRLGHQRQEGGERQAQDLAVERVRHGPQTSHVRGTVCLMTPTGLVASCLWKSPSFCGTPRRADPFVD